MLKAYIDDRHTTASAFVLAGYIAPVENWAQFSDEWAAVLDMAPPTKPFKMSEAHSRWSDDLWNERLTLLHSLIEKYVCAGVSMLIPYPEYSRVFKGKRYAKNPYHFASSI